MREININIEGYNVNGICVSCLNYNRRMYYDADIKDCFKLLGDIDVPDGLDIQVCWECLAYVKKAMRFKDQILKSYEFLISYSQVFTFLDSPKDFKVHAATRLSKTFFTEEWPSNDKDSEVKSETESVSHYIFDVSVKEEITEFLEDNIFDDLHSPARDDTSDDDTQPFLLKEMTVKVEKERTQKELQDSSEIETQYIQKKNRKLKNLPEDMVELCKITEEEMWSIRETDRDSKEFANVKFKCDDCIIAFNTKKLKMDHFNGKHQEKGEKCHQCSICQGYFLTRDSLASHKARHLSAYKCTVCGMQTTLKIRMLKHITMHRDVQEHKCENCGSKFSTKSKLLDHRSVCLQERPQCDNCGKVFANKMTLQHHLKIYHHNEDKKPKEKLFIPCKDCGKVLHSKKSYRNHIVIHNGVTYPCPICGKLFQWKRNLSRHTRNHREREAGALHECRTCGKSFASRDCYNNHMLLSKRHVPEDAYQHECTYCDKKFPTKWCLTDHIDWDHLKRKKYQCGICFKAFKSAKIMMVHVNNIHEGKKKEVVGENLCDICGKSYKTVKRLKAHVMAVHTKRPSTKSYKCKLCPATFTWPTGIYKHMKTMHVPNKKSKSARVAPTVKKEEPNPGIDRAKNKQSLKIVHIKPSGVNKTLVKKKKVTRE